jgi:hypothetical protein
MRNKIFGIGLSRTGTTSLTLALQILGYKAIHFPADEQTQSELYLFFASKRETVRLSILEQHDAITDTPACCLYQALDKCYPQSKFILTVRNKEAWLKSCERFWQKELIPFLHRDPYISYLGYIRYIHNKIYGIQNYDQEVFANVYDTYTAEVMRYFQSREEDLLILDICGSEGWEKLSPFLGLAIPSLAFPFENRGY